MGRDVVVRPVRTRADRRAFVALPYRLARGYPNWVLPFRLQTAELMDPKKHPFYEHSEVTFHLAERGGKVVGRIAAIEDREHNRTHGETTLHFGLFDCEDDPDVAAALFETVEAEARRRGFDMLRGPFNLSVHDEIGMQVSDFDQPNYVMIPGNPAYYPALVEGLGFAKRVDLYCYGLDLDKMSPRVLSMGPKVEKRHGLTLRALTRKSFDADTRMIREIYAEGWRDNWPWRAATTLEFDHIAKTMAQVADFDFVLIAETAEGEPAGFSLAVPNVNEAMAANRSGRLFPFGLIRLLWQLRRGGSRSARVVAMGVNKPLRNKGIDVVFHARQCVLGVSRHIRTVELSQVLETNEMMVRTAEMVGGHIRMRHRIYEKRVGDTV